MKHSSSRFINNVALYFSSNNILGIYFQQDIQWTLAAHLFLLLVWPVAKQQVTWHTHEFRLHCRSRVCIICGSGWERVTFPLHLVHSSTLQVTCVYYTSAWLGTYVASSTSPGYGIRGGFFPSSSSQVNTSLMSSAHTVGDALQCYSCSHNHISMDISI